MGRLIELFIETDENHLVTIAKKQSSRSELKGVARSKALLQNQMTGVSESLFVRPEHSNRGFKLLSLKSEPRELRVL